MIGKSESDPITIATNGSLIVYLPEMRAAAFEYALRKSAKVNQLQGCTQVRFGFRCGYSLPLPA